MEIIMNKTSTIIMQARDCGGSRAGLCKTNEQLAGVGNVDTNVRGSAYGEAFLTAPDRIEAIWFTSKLLGTIPAVGRVLFTTRPDAESRVIIDSTRGGAVRSILRRLLWRYYLVVSDRRRSIRLQRTVGRTTAALMQRLFLPAVASQYMFYDIVILSATGAETRRLRSKEPMIFKAEIASIPPLGTTFYTVGDVDFFDTADGTLALSMLAGSPGAVNDAPGLEIAITSPSANLSTGNFRCTATIRPAGIAPRRVCWFVTAVMGAKLLSDGQGIDVPLSDPLEISIAASFHGSNERAGVVIQCFSIDDPPMEAHQAIVIRDLSA
jgi:hypothetical protein